MLSLWRVVQRGLDEHKINGSDSKMNLTGLCSVNASQGIRQITNPNTHSQLLACTMVFRHRQVQEFHSKTDADNTIIRLHLQVNYLLKAGRHNFLQFTLQNKRKFCSGEKENIANESFYKEGQCIIL